MFKELEELGLSVTETQEGDFKRLTATKDGVPFMSVQVASEDDRAFFTSDCLDKLQATGAYVPRAVREKNLSA